MFDLIIIIIQNYIMRILEIVLSLLTTINNCRYHRLAKSKKGYIVASSPIYYSSPVFRYPVTYSTPTYVSPIFRTSPVVSSVVYPSPVISSSVVYSTPVYSTAYYRRLKKIKKDL